MKTLLSVQVLLCDSKICPHTCEAEMAHWKEKQHTHSLRNAVVEWNTLLFPGMSQHKSKLWDYVKGNTEGRGEMAKEETYLKDWVLEVYMKKMMWKEISKPGCFLLPVLFKCPQGWSN